MTVHRGRTTANNIMNIINNALVTAGYQQISSNVATDGFVYKTLGESGQDEFYLQFIDRKSNYITTAVFEKYVPNASAGLAGTFTNGVTRDALSWNYNDAAQTLTLDYIINVNKDRVLIFTQGNPLNSWNVKSFVYLGLPKRYDENDKNGYAAGITHLGKHNIANAFYTLKSRSANLGQYAQHYNMPTTCFGWGNQLFFSPIYIADGNEGYRGELDGFYIMEHPDEKYHIQHSDEFTKDGKNYIVIDPQPLWSNYGSLPTDHWYVMEI